MPIIPIIDEIMMTAVELLTPKYSSTLNILLNTREPEYNTTGKKDTTQVKINKMETKRLVNVS